jgi:arsenate reductase (glutaredoxin)
MTVTIYHNPACGTSRNTLAMIRQSGEEPGGDRVSEDPAESRDSCRTDRGDGIAPRDLLRRKGTPYDELGLDDPKWSDCTGRFHDRS